MNFGVRTVLSAGKIGLALTLLTLISGLAVTACSNISDSASTRAAATAATTQTPDSPASTTSSQTQTWTSSLYKISINCPQNWTKSEESLKDSQDNSNIGARHTPVEFSAPQREGVSECQVSLTVYLNPPGMKQPFNQWSLGIINAAADNSMGGTLLSSIATTLAGNPGYEITWLQEKGPLSSSTFQGIRIWAFIGTKIYDISGFVFAPASYSDYSPTILRMIDSFRILP